MGVEQRGGQESADQRAGDADERRDDESTRIVTGKDCLGDRAGE